MTLFMTDVLMRCVTLTRIFSGKKKRIASSGNRIIQTQGHRQQTAMWICILVESAATQKIMSDFRSKFIFKHDISTQYSIFSVLSSPSYYACRQLWLT